MQGQETDEEPTQRHNREAEPEAAERQAKNKAEYEARLAQADKAEAALDAALEASKKLGATKKLMHGPGETPWQLMHGDGKLEPVVITKSNPFADPVQTPVATLQPAATPAEVEPTPTPHPTPKRKKSPSSRSEEEDEDDEMEGGGGDPSTLAHDVQLKKIHQTPKKFPSRSIHAEEQVEGQGRMTDEVGAKRRMDEQENISRTYEIMGIPDQATTATTNLNWLIHDPEQADIPKHEICPDDCKWSKPEDGKKNFIVAFRTPASKSKIDAYMNKRTDLRYWDSVTNQMWNITKIYGRWTETLLQRDKRELLNIAWQTVKERCGIDAVFGDSAGLLLDHRCSRIRYKQTKKPMLVVTVAENAGDPGAKIFLTPVNPYSFAQMEDMIEERMKKEHEDRMKTTADSRAARATKNPEFVPKFQDSNVKRSALKYWRRTYRNTNDLQTLGEYKDTWNEIVEHAARIIQRKKDAWEQGQGKGQGRARGRGRGRGRDYDKERQPPRWQEGGSSGAGAGGGWDWEWQGVGHTGWHDHSQDRSFADKWKDWSRS